MDSAGVCFWGLGAILELASEDGCAFLADGWMGQVGWVERTMSTVQIGVGVRLVKVAECVRCSALG